MVAEADLRPEELDRLEDALEQLELEGALERWSEDELGPRVCARLADYRSVLAASRQALPLEDVPVGVLDDVLAQARQAAATPVVAEAREPWWARLRRSYFVPVLALAGSAALVLLVLDPDDHATLAEPPASTPATPAAADASARAEGEAIQAAPAAPTATPNAAATATAKDGGVEEVPNDDAEQAAALEAKLDAAKNEASASPGADRGMTSLGDVPGEGAGAGAAPSQPKAQTKSGGSAGPTSGRWDIVSRGDRLRQAGDCVAARDEYAVALEDDEPRVRARAFAGIGLCDAAAGDEASADANYERARQLDGEVGSFIESQSERSRGGDKKSRKPAKKSKVATDAFDPFG